MSASVWNMKTTETITSAEYRARYASKPHKPAKKKQSNKCITQMKLLLDIEGIKYKTEVMFHPTRKWRFDIAILDNKIAIEFEGGVFGGGKSRHTTGKGFTEDAEKYREAAKLGWVVLRYTSKGYSQMIEDVKHLLNQKEKV
jgi:hypothetical protein